VTDEIDPLDEGAGPTAPVRPDGLPDDYWDAKTGVKFDALLPQLKAYSDLKSSYVAKPEDIDWSLPEDLDPDPDAAWVINRDDPMLGAISKVFVEHKATQPMISAVAGAYAAQHVAQFKAAKAALDGERKKLGNKWQERHDAAKAFVTRAVGEKRAEAFSTTWVTAEQVEIIEALAKLAAGPGAAPITTVTPADGSPGRVFFEGMNSGNT